MKTVQDLINELSKLDPNQLILIDGYEEGLTEIRDIINEDILLDYYEEWWNGPHAILSHTFEKKKTPDAKAYIIKR